MDDEELYLHVALVLLLYLCRSRRKRQMKRRAEPVLGKRDIQEGQGECNNLVKELCLSDREMYFR